ncbi:MAG TPA: M20/M25/M40 family metallo-hydrolase [Acetobacteraceae bacterium]|nr:M20/M25/M40 family metallo-hydrolase [Acetobacteraceae bacterium]
MSDPARQIVSLLSDLVAIDSRSFVSNLPVAERVEQALAGFTLERLDYEDAQGVAKRSLVAHRGPLGGVALSAHMDTVPDTGWQDDPFSARLDEGMLHGLGATDLKGALATIIVAAKSLPLSVPVSLLISADEETTKEGARVIAARSALVREIEPTAIVVAEPTQLKPVRGHRSHIEFTAVATGEAAHSSTGRGRNANWLLLPFLNRMQEIFERLRHDPAWHDRAYEPPFSDFNLILDNHGTAINVTVPKATARIKYRYSAGIDPAPLVAEVTEAAERAGLALTITREGDPPELAPDHPLIRLATEITGEAPATAPYGTDASELQGIAPCVILGPGDIAVAHRPGEAVRIADLEAALPIFMRLAERLAPA